MPLPCLVTKGTLMTLQQNVRMNTWGLAMARNLSFLSFFSVRGWGPVECGCPYQFNLLKGPLPSTIKQDNSIWQS